MNRIWLITALLSCSAILFACQQKSATLAGDAASLPELPAHSAKTARPAKPGAQVSLVSAGQVNVTAGVSTRIDIVLSASPETGPLFVELNPGAGLQLLGAEKTYEFPGSETGQYQIAADLYVAANGRYYLNLNTRVGGENQPLFRSLAIIVQVGAVADSDSSAAVRLKTTPGENIIPLPAQEQIISQ